jgi:Rab3 GTPase-activating protein catalytic subunit
MMLPRAAEAIGGSSWQQQGGEDGLTGMLCAALEGWRRCAGAQSFSLLASEDWWLRQGAYLPPCAPDWVLQDAVRDVFAAPGMPSRGGPGLAEARAILHSPRLANNGGASGSNGGPAGKAAPADSLLGRLVLHSLVLSSPRSVAALWQRFLRELRFAHWDKREPLPRMPKAPQSNKEPEEAASSLPLLPPPPPDHRHCLIFQKLQLLDVCIHALQRKETATNSVGKDDASSIHARHKGSPEGVVGTAPGGATLLGEPLKPMNVPATQNPPPCTEDALWEQEAALAAVNKELDLDAGAALRIKMQGGLLLSDMSAFKAANPGCGFEDFVRWHSPRDWEKEEEGKHGPGRLSARMVCPGNAWRRAWEQAAPAAAAQQRPLFRPESEGERALHFLETLPPAVVWAELLATGTGAVTELLCRAPAARALPSVAAQMARWVIVT